MTGCYYRTSNLHHNTSERFETPFRLVWNITHDVPGDEIVACHLAHWLTCSTVGYSAKTPCNLTPNKTQMLTFSLNNHVVHVRREGGGGQLAVNCLTTGCTVMSLWCEKLNTSQLQSTPAFPFLILHFLSVS